MFVQKSLSLKKEKIRRQVFVVYVLVYPLSKFVANRTNLGGRRGILQLKIFRIPLFSRDESSHSLIIFWRIFLIILVFKC